MTSNQNSYLETIQACGQSLIETVNHVRSFLVILKDRPTLSTFSKLTNYTCVFVA
jgi:hypothetical protein